MAEILTVIPCLNEEHHLEKLALQLHASACAPSMRIVIADGGSTDGTLAIAQRLAEQYPNVLVLDNPKRVQSAGINLAVLSHAQDAQFLIRIDAHAEYPADYCDVLIHEAKATGAASVVVAMETVGRERFQKAVAAAQNSKLGNGGSAHRNASTGGNFVDHGHHALMRIDAFRKVGGYDESFSHNEDAELDLRLRKEGFTLWLTAKTSLIYYPRSTPLALFLQYAKYGSGRARTILKHRAIPRLRQLAPAAVMPAFLLFLISPYFPLAALPFIFWVLLCCGYGFWLAMETGEYNLAMAGPAAMIMHFGWSFGFWARMFNRWGLA